MSLILQTLNPPAAIQGSSALFAGFPDLLGMRRSAFPRSLPQLVLLLATAQPDSALSAGLADLAGPPAALPLASAGLASSADAFLSSLLLSPDFYSHVSFRLWSRAGDASDRFLAPPLQVVRGALSHLCFLLYPSVGGLGTSSWLTLARSLNDHSALTGLSEELSSVVAAALLHHKAGRSATAYATMIGPYCG